MSQMYGSENHMIGGAEFQNHFIAWLQQNNHLYLAVFSTVIFVWAVYADKLPERVRWQLSTTIGRALLLIVIYLVFMIAGWVPAVIVSVAVALTWANRPLKNPLTQESFNDIKKTKIDPTERWFVERALNENPETIIQDRVSTGAVQEDTVTGSKRSSR